MTRVLIAEDSPTQAEQLRLILEGEGFSVDAAVNAQEAMERFSHGPFDLVLSDIVMPGMSGYDLCHWIKNESQARDVPVILLSTLNDPMDIIRGLECAADNFITKPYDPEQLISRIRTVLQVKQARQREMLTFGVDVVFLGKKVTISSEKEQILDLLIATFEDIVRTNRGLQKSQAELTAAKQKIETYAQELERRVQERTADLVERQGQLVQAQKMEAVGQLTGGLAHDFNNLLMVVISNLDLLELELSDQSEIWKLADAALGAALRGAELTRKLLAFSRKQQLQSQAIDVNALVSGIAALLRSTLGENFQIVTHPGSDIWSAEADPAQVESALVNLAVNARDAMPDGGNLIVETANKYLDAQYAAENPEAVPGDYVMLAVSDTGAGMPAAILSRVFDPFFTTKDAGKGTGLGLSMVYGFVKQSGGHVKIYSEEGVGTTVRLYLPRAKLEAERQTPSPGRNDQMPLGNDELILVVEDNEGVRSVVVRQLVSLNYRVLEAENAAIALKLIKQGEAIDMLLTDIVMPGGISGFELAKTARAHNPKLAILYTTGFAESSTAENFTLIRSTNLLSKPYRKHELARKVRSVLAGDRA